MRGVLQRRCVMFPTAMLSSILFVLVLRGPSAVAAAAGADRSTAKASSDGDLLVFSAVDHPTASDLDRAVVEHARNLARGVRPGRPRATTWGTLR